MIRFSIATAAFSLAILAYGVSGGAGAPWWMGASGLVIAGVAWFSMRISSFLRIFIGLYVMAFWFLALAVMAQGAGLLSDDLKSFVPPAFMTLAVTGFALVVYGISLLAGDPPHHGADRPLFRLAGAQLARQRAVELDRADGRRGGRDPARRQHRHQLRPGRPADSG